MKKFAALLLALIMMMSLMACQATVTESPEPTEAAATEAPAETTAPEETAAPIESTEGETREFTDSAGRTVTVPTNITKVAISGPLTQIAIFALCPEKLVGVANAWTEEAAQYIPTEYYNLPELGQLYGGKGELNLETLLASGAEIVIDVGEPKSTVKEDLDALSEQTGIPFVHITATLATLGDAYRQLGDLLGMEEEAEVLATYCEDTYSLISGIVENVEKVKVLYCLGDEGLNVIANGSYHGEVIDMLCDNLAVVEEPSSKGSGNEVDMEQILAWDPDVILFASGSVYATVAEDEMWKDVRAIQEGNYYEVPFGPYNWLGFPPSAQRYLGMLWMTKLFYGDVADYDMYEKAVEYFELFYHCELTEEQYNALVANSLGKLA